MGTKHNLVMYGIYDPDAKDLVLVPGPDGYLYSGLPELKSLLFCVGVTGSNIVKITIESVDPSQLDEINSGSAQQS